MSAQPDEYTLRRFNHIATRMAFRYQIFDLTFEEFMNMAKQCKDRRAVGIVRDERNQLEGWVTVRGQPVAAKFSPEHGLIMTVLPSPPSQAVNDMLRQGNTAPQEEPRSTASQREERKNEFYKRGLRISQLEDEVTFLKITVEKLNQELEKYKALAYASNPERKST